MTDDELIARFEDCTLPPEEFHHRNHVRLAWLLLREGPLAALPRFGAGLRRYAASLGKAALYHETITWAYLLLIHERRERPGAPEDFDAFVEENPDLLKWNPSVLDRYYRKETLESDLARRVFLLPDRLAGG